MNDLPPEKRDIAMVFQFYALYPALTVGQNLAFPLHSERLGERRDRRGASTGSPRILHLADVLDRLPDQISEGEKQRVAVARAIIRDPNCFLFDEPLSRLDVELRQSMRGQIKEVLSGLSKATVIVTHDQLEALTMADRIAIMRDGIIEQIGSPHEVFAKPANTVRRQLHRHAADEPDRGRLSRPRERPRRDRARRRRDPPRGRSRRPPADAVPHDDRGQATRPAAGRPSAAPTPSRPRPN